jgi:hypothetical protein
MFDVHLRLLCGTGAYRGLRLAGKGDLRFEIAELDVTAGDTVAFATRTLLRCGSGGLAKDARAPAPDDRAQDRWCLEDRHERSSHSYSQEQRGSQHSPRRNMNEMVIMAGPVLATVVRPWPPADWLPDSRAAGELCFRPQRRHRIRNGTMDVGVRRRRVCF